MRHATYACWLLGRQCQRPLAELSKRYIGHVVAATTATGDATFAAAAVSASKDAAAHHRTSSSNDGRATVLDGRAVAAAWERELHAEVRNLTELLGRPPGLGVVLVGSRPDSMLYVAKKQEACQKAGMQTFVHHLPDSVSQAQLEAAVSHACADCRVDGVLIQLPLPRHLSEEAVMEVLDPRKDVDGFHPINMGRMLMRGRGVRLVPATPLGCIELLRRSGVEVQGKTCVVLGDSNIVGTPLAAMLRDKGAAAVTICHRRSYREWFEDQEQVQRTRAAAAVCLPGLPGPSRPPPSLVTPPPADAADASAEAAAAAAASSGAAGTDAIVGSGGGGEATVHEGFQSYQLPYLTRSADILVVAVGHPELVRSDWVRPGAVVIDVGINVVSTLPRARSPPGAAAAGGPAGAETLSGRTDAAAGAPPPDQEGDGSGGGCSDAAAGQDHGTTGNGASGFNGHGGGWMSSCGGGSSSGRNVMFQVVGDVSYEEVSQVAGAITPVPGGVGPMTIAAVLHNTLKAAKYRVGLEPW
ncbi:hypothetical protein PLESTB_000510100 [Pleodorina starrii]|uniref:methenyltetrahydrofolate cyclohydrolase n=1 Tax=Pleodorina starrii TaxID=330485 RepID=A0A9W6EZX1_9CHLO|nr:hypothetical protein PLESTM_000124800 [Pleodorina starrii]GLC51508.1 hypothetical protein PLESTB_000510100 [Pleodorina starrii]GLC75058.1 hypothetical protein PLESTF_001588400 [Pleodorina starrii]